jgi:3-methyladenine DNA glycosylase Tag
MTTSFAPILEAALVRHGAGGLEARLATPRSAAELQAVPDDRYLSAMSLRIFQAGLKHSLVAAKWPAFEEVFAGFDPEHCARLYDETIEEHLADRRLIRHLPKLRSIRENAAAVLDIRAEHGSMGAWLAAWPGEDVVGLWHAIGRRFVQMGGNSAPAFLRMVGKDTFILTDAVVKALNIWQAFAGEPRSKRDQAEVQQLFNAWARETDLPLCRMSQILAMSVST